MTVAVVTDSTAYLPAEAAREAGVTVVPLQVVIGGSGRDEGTGVAPSEVAAALRAYVPVSTSRPSPQAMLAAYEAAAAAGADAVVSVHLSAEMSGTCSSAELAARESPVPVQVVDSRSLGMAMGFAVLSAAGAASEGADADDVAAIARDRAAASSAVFYVDTLEHLRRGGRIGAAQAVLGSALSVKPLLRLEEGRIVPFERVRTGSRALQRLEEVAVADAGDREVDVAVHHLDSAERAQQLAGRLRDRLPWVRELLVLQIGAVVGAHVGPGMLAVVVSPTCKSPAPPQAG